MALTYPDAIDGYALSVGGVTVVDANRDGLFRRIQTSDNGNGQNVRIGDDVWLGDINAANAMSLRGAQDASKGFIRFGSSAYDFGFDGTNLVYAGGTIWHTGNLTNLNQLTNGPGFISLSSPITGYVVGSNTALADTDTLLAALGKVQGQINSRLTANQTITLSGDASGSGTMSISVTNHKIVVTEHSANNTEYPVVWENAAKQLYKTAAKMTFNPSLGRLTATAFAGPLTGNASTATALQNARTLTIGSTGKSFNGSANVAWTLGEIGARANTSPVSGSWWQGTPIVGSDGVMEVGKYIDFHDTNAGTSDFSVRLSVSDATLSASGLLKSEGLAGPGNRPVIVNSDGLFQAQDGATFCSTIGALPMTHSIGSTDRYAFSYTEGANTGSLDLTLFDDNDGSEAFIIKNGAGSWIGAFFSNCSSSFAGDRLRFGQSGNNVDISNGASGNFGLHLHAAANALNVYRGDPGGGTLVASIDGNGVGSFSNVVVTGEGNGITFASTAQYGPSAKWVNDAEGGQYYPASLKLFNNSSILVDAIRVYASQSDPDDGAFGASVKVELPRKTWASDLDVDTIKTWRKYLKSNTRTATGFDPDSNYAPLQIISASTVDVIYSLPVPEVGRELIIVGTNSIGAPVAEKISPSTGTTLRYVNSGGTNTVISSGAYLFVTGRCLRLVGISATQWVVVGGIQ